MMNNSDRRGASDDAPIAPPPLHLADCALCTAPGGTHVWSNDALRVVLVDEPAYPGFTRVICQRHIAEMTDLPLRARLAVMTVVWEVEAVQREVLSPDKINVASLGNMVPHVHWHVIPRWRDDACFPDAVWAPERRTDGGVGQGASRAAARLHDYVLALRAALEAS